MTQRIGLIYGTDTGNTEEVGNKIISNFDQAGKNVEMLNIADCDSDDIEAFDFIIMGIPTWDFGGIQEDWEDFEDEIIALNLQNKAVAFYGLGDQFGYSDYFIDAVGWLNERIKKTGATVIGHWPTEGYDFDASLAANEDKSVFCGLAIDEDQQFELSDERIKTWCEQILEEFADVTEALCDDL